MSVSITPKDMDIFLHMGRTRFLTANQTAALFYAQPDNGAFDIKRAKTAAYDRLEKLARNDYISSAPGLNYDNRTIKIYFLSKHGADIIKDLREQEDAYGNRVPDRKASYGHRHGPHDILVGDILTNLILLSRTLKTFELNEWLGDRDCRFHVFTSAISDKKVIFDPDLYLSINSGDTNIPMFFEVERGTNTRPVLRRKILRFFQYYAHNGYIEDLGLERFPRSCFIMSNKSWKSEMVKLIKEAKVNYNGSKAGEILDFPFWITSMDQVDPCCITEGRLSISILGNIWTKHTGENNASAFF